MDLNEFGNWKDIDGYPNYMVSDQGYVLSKTKMNMLKTLTNGDGYKSVFLYRDRKTR